MKLLHVACVPNTSLVGTAVCPSHIAEVGTETLGTEGTAGLQEQPGRQASYRERKSARQGRRQPPDAGRYTGDGVIGKAGC